MKYQQLALKVQKVNDILRSSGFSHVADKMEALLMRVLQTGDEDALKEIVGRCSIKSLGDLNVKGVNDKEWLGLLAEVGQLASTNH